MPFIEETLISGEKRAPFLTLFVGGNHEASNYLAELPYGGWVAPNIYYMGWGGVVSFCGIKIGGISGIYNHRDFNRNHHEFPPYDNSSLRTTYHVRSLEVYRFLQYAGNVDIFFSHDWPLGIHDFGNTQELLRKKSKLVIERNCPPEKLNEQWTIASRLKKKKKKIFFQNPVLIDTFDETVNQSVIY